MWESGLILGKVASLGWVWRRWALCAPSGARPLSAGRTQPLHTLLVWESGSGAETTGFGFDRCGEESADLGEVFP